MYRSEDSSNNGNSLNNRETLQLSPHIAAHKSSNCLIQGTISTLNNSLISQSPAISSTLKLHPNDSYVSHTPAYRTSVLASTIHKGGLEYYEPLPPNNRRSPVQVVKTLPQDLSSHASKSIHLNDSEQKPHPPVHNAVNQGNDAYSPVFVTERPSAYYRLVDGTTIAIAGQHHQTLLLSTLTSDPINSSVIQSGSSLLPPQSSATIAASQSGNTITNTLPNIVENHEDGIIIPDVLPNALLSNQDFLAIKEHLDAKKIKEEDDEGERKDLVKQALHAAVVQNTQRGQPDQEVIEYNYSTEDIAGSGDCLVHEDLICHSTFCPQPNFKSQELLLMNIHSQNNQNASKTNGAESIQNLNEASQGGQVLLVQPGIMDEGAAPAFVISPSKRRRTRPTETVQLARRERIATRMREKRASESEDQKMKRRIREAERMRRKRAMEDEDSKVRRRREAAERARLRRAKLSPDEKDSERQKAARRMRLRRQNENDDQKRIRRLKAAERMRKRRSTETPEERAARRQALSLRIKAKRKLKDTMKMENLENVFLFDPEGNREEAVIHHSDSNRDGVIVSEPPPHFLSQGHLITVPGNLAFLQADSTPNQSSSTETHLIPMDLASIPQSIAFRPRNVLSPLSNKVEDIENGHLALHKLAVITQGPSTSNLPDDVQSISRTTVSSPSLIEPISLHKSISTSLVNSHHLPHILNHHTLATSAQDVHQPILHENHPHLPQSISHHTSIQSQIRHH